MPRTLWWSWGVAQSLMSEVPLYPEKRIVHWNVLATRKEKAQSMNMANTTAAHQWRERESSLLSTYWSGSTDAFGGPASRHGSLNSLFQVAVYLPS